MTDALTLHVYPSPFGLDWSTPRTLARTAVLNSVPDLFDKDGTSIGHVTVHVDAGPRKIVTGMTQADRGESSRMLLSGGLGMGILFHDFKGKLEEGGWVSERLARRAAKGSSSFVSFRLRPEASGRLARYFDEYAAKGCGAHYGLPHRPLRGEGGGCSAFAASFLKTAGLLSAELQAAWGKTIAVPLSCVGGPLTGRRVSLWSLLLSGGARWAAEGEPAKSVDFYDPDALHAWILGKVGEKGPGYEVQTVGRASGIVFDASQAPVPAGPIWEAA